MWEWSQRRTEKFCIPSQAGFTDDFSLPRFNLKETEHVTFTNFI